MPRATALLASAAALVSLAVLTACGPDDPANAPATPSQSSAAAPPPSTSAAPAPSPTGGDHTAPTGVPDTAWMAARDIPLDAAYHWPALAGVAKGGKNPVLQAETVCGSKRSADLDGITGGANAAKATLGSGEDWHAQETLVNWPGTTSGAMQTSAALFRGISDEIKSCATTAPGATVKVTVDDGQQLVASLTVPQPGGASVTLHEYLVNNAGTVAELAVWSGPHPKTVWAATDATVLKGLNAPLCSAFKDC
jgi:hypothetical protein